MQEQLACIFEGLLVLESAVLLTGPKTKPVKMGNLAGFEPKWSGIVPNRAEPTK